MARNTTKYTHLEPYGFGANGFGGTASTYSKSKYEYADNYSFENWTGANVDNWLKTGGTLTQSTDSYIGTYSAALSDGTVIVPAALFQSAHIFSSTHMPGYYKIVGYCKATVSATSYFAVSTPHGAATTSLHSGGGGWEKLESTANVLVYGNESVSFTVANLSSTVAYFDNVYLELVEPIEAFNETPQLIYYRGFGDPKTKYTTYDGG